MALSLELGIKALAEAVAAKIKGLVPRINAATELTADRVMTAADSGGSFIYNGVDIVYVSFPSSLPLGFTCKIENSGVGQVALVGEGTLQFGNASRNVLTFQWDVVDVELKQVNGARVIDLIYNLALPVLYAENTAAVSRNVVGLSAIPGLSLPMEVNAAYNVDIIIPFTSAITTNSLRVGLLALPAGCTCALEVSIWNALGAGTAPKTNHFWMNSATAVTGTPGTASVVGSTMLARVTGRVRTGGTAGNLAVTAGATNTNGAQSIAANAASMSISKVYDQGRT